VIPVVSEFQACGIKEDPSVRGQKIVQAVGYGGIRVRVGQEEIPTDRGRWRFRERRHLVKVDPHALAWAGPASSGNPGNAATRPGRVEFDNLVVGGCYLGPSWALAK